MIVTSSFAAVVNLNIPQDAGKIFTSEDWNPISWEEVLTTADKTSAYLASKKFAEKAGTK